MLRSILLGASIFLGILVPAHAEGPVEHIVKVVSDYENLRMAFKPKIIVIQPGDTVTWINEANEDHNIVSYPDGFPKGAKAVSSPYLKKKGEKWSHTFHRKGTYEYHCIPHLPMGMHGTVIVSHPSTAEEFHVPSIDEMKAYSKRLREFFNDEEFKYKPRHQRTQAPEPEAFLTARMCRAPDPTISLR